MGGLRRILIYCFCCVSMAVSGDSCDDLEIKKIILRLYAEPIESFVYSRQYHKPVEYWKNKYQQYYTKTIVDFFIKKIANPKIEPLPLIEWDPRFSPVLGEFSTVTRLSILDISRQGKNKIALVVYYTTDGLNPHKSITEYYMVKDSNGWRISNQWLGCVMDISWNNVSELRQKLPKNREPELLDYLE